MTILVDRTKKEFNLNDSAIAYASSDLANMQFCCVESTGGATGNLQVTNPTGQGTHMYAVLENAPAAGEIAQLVVEGICEIRAHSTFNAGVEVTVHDSNGRIEAAGSGDFVVGIAREASQSAGQAVSVTLVHYYKA
jgi:predicted RecA/RadA family phage recombinase